MRLDASSVLAASFIASTNAAPGSFSQDFKRSFAITSQDLAEYEAPQNGGKQFTMSQIPNGRFQQLDAPSALLKAHAKYRSSLPPRLKKASEINPNLGHKFKAFYQANGPVEGSAIALSEPSFDSEYVVPVDIGTPPQRTYLNLDTGSSDFWTFSTDTFPFAADGHTLYRPRDSSTSKLLDGERWFVRYGDGAGAGGVVYTDRVQLGDIVAVYHQAVQAAVEVSFDISSDQFSSGIIGMASSGANTVRPTPQKTYLDNIKDELALPIFTADLQKGRPGAYEFGYINQSRFDGSMQFAPINPFSPLWEVRVEGYQVGEKGSYESFIWDSIVDTGTTLLLAPEQIMNDYYSQVKGAAFDDYYGMVVYPCEEDTPDFIFGVGPYRGVVPGHYMNYANANQTHCYGGMQTSEGIGFSVLGDILLKAQYVVFDVGAHAVGFANKKTLPT